MALLLIFASLEEHITMIISVHLGDNQFASSNRSNINLDIITYMWDCVFYTVFSGHCVIKEI